MADFQSPEVRVSEKRSTPVTFPSFSPGVGAFIGIAEKGPINVPTLVNGIDEAQEVYGDFISTSNLMDEVKAFFDNGGQACFISRIAHYTDIAVEGSLSAVAASTTLDNGTTDVLKVTASSAGNFGNALRVSTSLNNDVVAKVAATVAGSTSQLVLSSVLRVFVGDTISIFKTATTYRSVVKAVDTVTKKIVLTTAITVPVGGFDGSENVVSETFNVQTVDKYGTPGPTFRNLRTSPLAEKLFAENKVNSVARSPVAIDVLSLADNVDGRPTAQTNTLLGADTAGADGGSIVDADYVGSAASKTGLYAFDNNEDFLLLAIPGITTLTVVKGLETYVENRQDIFGITDIPQGLIPDAAVTFIRSTANLASSYLATYYPWLRAPDARTGGVSSFPPSGYVMGVYARTFANRNFGKAPAGVDDGRIYNVVGVDYEVQKPAYDVLYPKNINAIQPKRGKGICVMGARTLDSAGDMLQVNRRIVFLVVKRVFKEGTQFALFENNDRALRARIKRYMTVYLRGLRTAGVLSGDTDDEAFFIICDETNNTATVRKTGKVVCRVGLNVGDTVEFLEITLEQDTRQIDAELASEAG
jgi:phage tail sheath protein FI